MKRRIAYVLILVLAMMSLTCAVIAETKWKCENCNAEELTGKFCPECGSARPSEDWVCPNCGRTNQRNYCPDCGTGREAAQQTDTAAPSSTGEEPVEAEKADEETLELLTIDKLMDPEEILTMMNASIAVVCQQMAEEQNVDAAELFNACALRDYDSKPQFLSFGNEKWDAALYFYYPNEDAPDPQTEATYWCMAVKGTDERASILRSIAFSATITLLKQVDPEMDGGAAVDFLRQQEPDSRYEGNGYRMIYLVTEEGDDMQIMVERT